MLMLMKREKKNRKNRRRLDLSKTQTRLNARRPSKRQNEFMKRPMLQALKRVARAARRKARWRWKKANTS